MFFLFFVFFAFLNVTLADWSSEFAYNTYLDSGNKYRLFWTKLNDSFIEFGIQCESLGWVGFGISPEGFMTYSDIAFGWIGEDNTCYLQNRHTGSQHVTPTLSAESDLTFIECFRVGNITSFRFIRPIHPCNSNDTKILDGTTHVIYAWNNDNIPNVTNFDNTVEWHDTNRGSNSVYLLSGTTFNATLENNTKTFDILNANYTIPSAGTTYNCKLIKLPALNKTNHITKFGPVITPSNINIVHHMLVYNCPASLVREQDIGHSEDCNSYVSSSLPSAGCIYGSVLFAWAIGADDFTVPSEVGFDLSGTSSTQYVILEIHYNNVYQVSNVSDSSGIRIYYTPTLRKYSASTIEIGLEVNGYSQFLPAGSSSLANYGYCADKCTGVGIPENGTNIFASFLHAHLHGIALSLRQIRNGVELPRIDSNWHYDFDYQATTAHTQTITLLPNDTLILECYYQTLNTNQTIFSGESTSNEMCLSFLYVYPPVTLSTCLSSHYRADVEEWATIAYLKHYVTNFTTFNYNLSVNGALEWYNVLWNNYTSRYQFCANHNVTTLISDSNVVFLKENEYDVYNVSSPCTPLPGKSNDTIKSPLLNRHYH